MPNPHTLRIVSDYYKLESTASMVLIRIGTIPVSKTHETNFSFVINVL